jgi:hypothetical protein
MAADEERAERIRALKQGRPDLTWRRIADHVGVTERSATDWQKKGGIEYDNAKKLAELFEVDVDYVWRGVESDTPSPFAGQDDTADRLDRIEERLTRIEDMLTSGTDLVDRLARLEELMLGGLDQLEEALSGRVDGLARSVDQAGLKLRGGVPHPKPAAKAPAQKRTRPASKRGPA